MGSWNDMGFQGQDQVRYEKLSGELFALLNDAIIVSTNSTAAHLNRMRREYDFSKSRKNPYASQLKRQVSLRLDTSATGDVPILGAVRGVVRNADINGYRKHLSAKYR
jgi:hypothetical protein